MNDFADNYDPSANMSDSSCLFNNIQEPFIYVSNPINGLIYPQDIFSGNTTITFSLEVYNVTIGAIGSGEDAFIRYYYNGVPESLNSTEDFSVELDTGYHSFEFESLSFLLDRWSSSITSTISFYIGPAGCTDEIACNFDPLAVAHDYSCIYPAFYYDCSDVCNSDIDNDLICDELEILGCQDSLALNYDSSATDAGVCDYLGCTDSLYIEFNQNATIDDGSC